MEILKDLSMAGFGELLSTGYNLEIVNKENISVLREKPRCPAVLYFNHSTTDDPLLIYQLVRATARERMKNAIVPVSERYTKLKNFPAYSVFVSLLKAWEVDTPKIVQSYRLRSENNQDGALQSKASLLGESLFRVLGSKLPSGPLIVLSPEGHRSENGQLLPAEGGAGLIAQFIDRLKNRGLLEEGYFIPIGISLKRSPGKRLYFNPHRRPAVKCTVGKPITAGAAVSFGKIVSGEKRPDPKVISHYLMSQVARLLPENMQGVYHPDLISDTFQGRFEQRQDSKGKVYPYDNSPKP